MTTNVLEREQQATTETAQPEAARTPTFRAPVDVYEVESGYVIQANLPGVAREDLTVEVRENTLYFEGTARAAETPRIRRPYNSFRYARSFTLGKAVDAERIEAELKDGVLTVRLPKVAAVQPRKIEVQTR